MKTPLALAAFAALTSITGLRAQTFHYTSNEVVPYNYLVTGSAVVDAYVDALAYYQKRTGRQDLLPNFNFRWDSSSSGSLSGGITQLSQKINLTVTLPDVTLLLRDVKYDINLRAVKSGFNAYDIVVDYTITDYSGSNEVVMKGSVAVYRIEYTRLNHSLLLVTPRVISYDPRSLYGSAFYYASTSGYYPYYQSSYATYTSPYTSTYTNVTYDQMEVLGYYR